MGTKTSSCCKRHAQNWARSDISTFYAGIPTFPGPWQNVIAKRDYISLKVKVSVE
jgi:hypothetical protein